jgi:hypothetical protein
MQPFRSKLSAWILSMGLLLSGCTSTLVRDDVKRTSGLDGHCTGSKWVDDSSIAVLPVPIVAFITPAGRSPSRCQRALLESVRSLDAGGQS